MAELDTSRLDAFDEIFQKTPKLYYVELKADSFYSKVYSIKVLKDNTEEIRALSQKIDTLIKENNRSLETLDMEEFNSLSDKVSALTQETEEKGKVIAKQYKNYLAVEFYAEDKLVKKFNVKNDEYMDSVLNFFKKEYKDYL